MTIRLLLALVWMHFVADFIMQTHAMAKNKSSSNWWLAFHVAVYTAPFFIFGWKFALVNGIVHGLVDYVTSRVNKRLWAQGKVHWFFVGVGVDQAIHMSTLVLTLWLISR